MADDVTAVAPEVPTTTSDVPNQITPPVPDASQLPVDNRAPQASPAQQNPQSAAPPPPQRSGLSAILAAVGNALGGGATRGQVNPQTGAIEQVNRSTGSKIGSAIATLARGAAAGAAQHGPGATGRAALAGVQSQDEFQQQQEQKLKGESENVRQTQAANQQQLLTQASLAKSNQDMARTALAIKGEGRALDEHEAAIANGLQAVSSVPGAQKLAHFDSNSDINGHLESVGPDLAKKYAVDMAKNEIRVVPNPEGGFDAYRLPKNWHDQTVGDGHTVHVMTYDADPKTGKVTPQMKAVPAPATMTWGDQQNWEAEQFKTLANYNESQTKQAKEAADTTEALANSKKAIADTSEAYVSGKLKLAQAKNLEGGGAKNDDGTWNQASIPVALVEHNMDPTQLSKRSADYNAKLKAAGEYSLEKYGKPFDIAQAQEDYTYAKTPATQNTLKMVNSITEPNGSMEIAKKAAAGLPAFNEKTLNKIFNAGATEFGSPEATNVHTAMLGLADEYSQVMGAGKGSDISRQQALDIMKQSYSKGQIAGAFDILQRDVDSRKANIIKDNSYLIKQYGAPKPQAPAGATNEVFGPDGKTVTGHVVNGAYVPLAAH